MKNSTELIEEAMRRLDRADELMEVGELYAESRESRPEWMTRLATHHRETAAVLAALAGLAEPPPVNGAGPVPAEERS